MNIRIDADTRGKYREVREKLPCLWFLGFVKRHVPRSHLSHHVHALDVRGFLRDSVGCPGGGDAAEAHDHFDKHTLSSVLCGSKEKEKKRNVIAGKAAIEAVPISLSLK